MVDGQGNDPGFHSFRRIALRLWSDHAIVFYDQEPGRLPLPRWLSHALAQTFECDWFLDRGHECCFLGICIWVDGIAKSVGCNPKQAIGVRLKLWCFRMGSYASENLADCLAFIRHNCGDIDQRFYLGIVASRGGNDGAAIGMTHEHDWCVLAPQRTAERGSVVSQGCQRELRCDNFEAPLLQFG